MEVFFKSKTILQIIDIFARFKVYDSKDSLSIDKSHLDRYLSPMFSNKTKLEFLDYFQFQISNNGIDNSVDIEEYLSETKQLINSISNELTSNQKYEFFTAILCYVIFIEKNYNSDLSNKILRAQLVFIIDIFGLNKSELKDLELFMRDNISSISKSESVILISRLRRFAPKSFKTLNRPNIIGKVYCYYLSSINSFFVKYSGDEILTINNQILVSSRTYQLATGGIIEGADIKAICFNDLYALIKKDKIDEINLTVQKICKTYKSTGLGVKELSFSVSSGELVAILGASGSGKTTLLNMLSGILKPDSGKVNINGYDLEQDYEYLKGHIGYVSQEDLLIEELTVMQNLLFNTRLCRDDLSKKEKIEAVNEVLKELGLYAIKDLKIGSPTDKIISGGQRKRLNIALELIRKPSIIYVDEPTSGLSSSDALIVVDHLSKLTQSGKIVMMNIHQPSSDIFFLLDKLLIMDRKGHIAYFGNPFSASTHFKRHLEFEDTAIEDNYKFGFYNPDRVINLLEYKAKDLHGNVTEDRLISSERWYKEYQANFINDDYKHVPPKNKLSEKVNKAPKLVKQLVLFTERNFVTRFTDKGYLMFVLLGPPLLAFLMSIVLKSTNIVTHEYVFSENANIPIYLFVNVLIAIFFGLIVSSGEVFKDKRILKRESFLSLSPFAYLSSKIVFLSVVNAYQIAILVFIGNAVLAVQGMFFYFFIILWVTAMASSALGLIISTLFRSILTIYIIIPFLLIPKIILSGAILNFDRIHHNLTSYKYVPVYADLAISRWGYEGIVNAQFNMNAYSIDIEDHLINKSKSSFVISFLLPELENEIEKLKDTSIDQQKVMDKIRILLLEIENNFPDARNTIQKMDKSNVDSMYFFVKKLRKWININLKNTNSNIADILSRKDVAKRNYYNNKLGEFMLNKTQLQKFISNNNQFIRKYEPAYHINHNKFGRSHYYAPYKQIFNLTINTWLFNTLVLGVISIFLYTLTYFFLVRRYY